MKFSLPCEWNLLQVKILGQPDGLKLTTPVVQRVPISSLKMVCLRILFPILFSFLSFCNLLTLHHHCSCSCQSHNLSLAQVFAKSPLRVCFTYMKPFLGSFCGFLRPDSKGWIGFLYCTGIGFPKFYTACFPNLTV